MPSATRRSSSSSPSARPGDRARAARDRAGRRRRAGDHRAGRGPGRCAAARPRRASRSTPRTRRAWPASARSRRPAAARSRLRTWGPTRSTSIATRPRSSTRAPATGPAPRRRRDGAGLGRRQSSTTTARAATAPPSCCRWRGPDAARARGRDPLRRWSPTAATRPPAPPSPKPSCGGRAPRLAPLGLELQDVKRDGLEVADEQGDVFMSIFTTFGSFSIVAGMLLIFLIFVMLSAERRAELGIARAVGTRREHVVQMFVFEGLAYDLGAAAVGAALGVAISFAMVSVMASAFGSAGPRDRARRDAAQPRHRLRARRAADVRGRRALRLAGEPAQHRRRGARPARAARAPRRPPAHRLAGAVVRARRADDWSGLQAAQATPFSLGISLAIISLVPLARAAGVPRTARLLPRPARAARLVAAAVRHA